MVRRETPKKESPKPLDIEIKPVKKETKQKEKKK